MPRVSQEHLDARRRQILEAAVACFARNGFHQTTMQDIFRAAELSPGAVYRYFPSKAAIVQAIAAEAQATAIRVVFGGPGGPPPPLADAGTRPYAAIREIPLGEEGDRVRLAVQLFAEAVRDPEIAEHVRGVTDIARAGMGAVIRAAQDRGEVDPALDPEALARAVVALFHGFLLQRAWYGEEADERGYIAAVHALLSGAVAGPGAAEPAEEPALRGAPRGDEPDAAPR